MLVCVLCVSILRYRATQFVAAFWRSLALLSAERFFTGASVTETTTTTTTQK